MEEPMYQTDLWKYCTKEYCRDMLLSFRLLGNTSWPDQKVMACLYAFSNHTERYYRTVRIPKRDGRQRSLMVPDYMLMRIQRNILHHILDGYEVSSCATAYHKGPGVVSNARDHTGKHVVVKLDIKDFFGSISNGFKERFSRPAISSCSRNHADCLVLLQRVSASGGTHFACSFQSGYEAF